MNKVVLFFFCTQIDLSGCGFLLLAVSVILIVFASAYGISYFYEREYLMDIIHGGIVALILSMVYNLFFISILVVKNVVLDYNT